MSDEITYESISAADPNTVRYYHGRITREESETRLSQCDSIDGLYLLRDHLFHDAYYVLSMHFKGEITHYVVVRNFQDGTVSFTGSERTFTGLLELISYYSRHPSRLPCQLKKPCLLPVGVSAATFEDLSPEELKQEMISIALMHKLSKDEIRKTLSSPRRSEFERLTRKFLHQKRVWFHGAISKRKAEKRLEVSGYIEGSYLLWLKSKTRTYYLSLCYKGSVIHYPIKMETVLGQVSFEISNSKCFDSLMLLIDYYQKQKEILANLLIFPCDVKEHTQKNVHDTRILISGPLPKVFKNILEIDDLDNIKYSNRGERPRYIPIEDGTESVSKAAGGGVRGANKKNIGPSSEQDYNRHINVRCDDEDEPGTDSNENSLFVMRDGNNTKKKDHKKIGDNGVTYADVKRAPPMSPRMARNEPVDSSQHQLTEMLHMANRYRPLDPIHENVEGDDTSVVSRGSSISSAVEAIGPVISNPRGHYRLCLIRVPENRANMSPTPTSDYQSSDASDNTLWDSADNTVERQSRRQAREARVHFAE